MKNNRCQITFALIAFVLMFSCNIHVVFAADINSALEETEFNLQQIGIESAPAVVSFTDSPELIEQAATDSVAELLLYDIEMNLIARASGFAAVSDRLLITGSHVLEGVDHMKVSCESGSTYRLSMEEMLCRDKDADVAVFLLPEECELLALPCAGEPPLRGEKVAAIGSARGILNLVSFGNVCGHWSDGWIDWLIFSAPVSAGSSGGPLINDNGEVIGVIMGSYDDSQNLNFAVPIEEVVNLVKQEVSDDYLS